MYCVNCGVKLADSQKVCPLCDTVVFHPDFPRQEGESLYPENTMPVPQVSSRGAQIIATALFLLPREEGQLLLDECGAIAMWVDREGNKYYSPGFEEIIQT